MGWENNRDLEAIEIIGDHFVINVALSSTESEVILFNLLTGAVLRFINCVRANALFFPSFNLVQTCDLIDIPFLAPSPRYQNLPTLRCPSLGHSATCIY